MEKPPPPGISNIGQSGTRTSIDGGGAPPAPAKNRQPATRRARGQEVLVNVDQGRRISGGASPAGVLSREQDIVEIPIAGTRLPIGSTTSFESIDGTTYAFRTLDPKGNPLPYRNEMALFLALIEVAKGGNPFTVFDAFKLKIKDLHDQQVYPVPQEILESLQARGTLREPEPALEHEEYPSDFTLGE